MELALAHTGWYEYRCTGCNQFCMPMRRCRHQIFQRFLCYRTIDTLYEFFQIASRISMGRQRQQRPRRPGPHGLVEQADWQLQAEMLTMLPLKREMAAAACLGAEETDRAMRCCNVCQCPTSNQQRAPRFKRHCRCLELRTGMDTAAHTNNQRRSTVSCEIFVRLLQQLEGTPKEAWPDWALEADMAARLVQRCGTFCAY